MHEDDDCDDIRRCDCLSGPTTFPNGSICGRCGGAARIRGGGDCGGPGDIPGDAAHVCACRAGPVPLHTDRARCVNCRGLVAVGNPAAEQLLAAELAVVEQRRLQRAGQPSQYTAAIHRRDLVRIACGLPAHLP